MFLTGLRVQEKRVKSKKHPLAKTPFSQGRVVEMQNFSTRSISYDMCLMIKVFRKLHMKGGEGPKG